MDVEYGKGIINIMQFSSCIKIQDGCQNIKNSYICCHFHGFYGLSLILVHVKGCTFFLKHFLHCNIMTLIKNTRWPPQLVLEHVLRKVYLPVIDIYPGDCGVYKHFMRCGQYFFLNMINGLC